MFGFLLRSTTYLFLWKKFQKEIIFIFLSMVFIGIISSLYEDLYNVLKVSDKDALLGILLLKWLLISFIIWFNIRNFKEVKWRTSDKEALFRRASLKRHPKKSKQVLKKKKLPTTTDLILKKYTDA